ncbi:hypothetical protein HS088_TW04G00732 [Tripterygium wilfordii]|uniref:Transducin/WD40 repeat-like superfamily protein n=1 Tax=Tripterygium wilfordii TaxID=458696 RepID=A0A7J7DRJ0_TRIWF|nr:hypothetical protein HS088_TW04G00732 [Tripterygium wilfordii]
MGREAFQMGHFQVSLFPLIVGTAQMITVSRPAHHCGLFFSLRKRRGEEEKEEQKEGRAFELNKKERGLRTSELKKTRLEFSFRNFWFLMDKYVVTLKPATKDPKSIRRYISLLLSHVLPLTTSSGKHNLITLPFIYIESATFYLKVSMEAECPRIEWKINRIAETVSRTDDRIPVKKQGLSALEFDSKGIYLASVTKSGCLTVHDFEVLYCQSQTKDSSPCSQEDESKILVHLSVPLELDSVRWNPSNQDEVWITYPLNQLKLIASDTNGVLHVWDKRTSSLPCLELTTNSYGIVNSIQLNVDSQVIFGAGKQGIIYSWDLRGGKTSAMFQTHNVARYPPLTSLKLSSMLERIGPLKAQSNIVSKEIHSINLDPSCPHQLAFHLDDGWSGVLDLHNLEVTHIHCPPPAWLNGSSISDDQLHLRKPTWLPTYSIYVVGSSSENGIHLLDFYPHASSPSHVYNEDIESLSRDNRRKQHNFIPMSEAIIACAAHPLNGTIVAGTKVCDVGDVFWFSFSARALLCISICTYSFLSGTPCILQLLILVILTAKFQTF